MQPVDLPAKIKIRKVLYALCHLPLCSYITSYFIMITHHVLCVSSWNSLRSNTCILIRSWQKLIHPRTENGFPIILSIWCFAESDQRWCWNQENSIPLQLLINNQYISIGSARIRASIRLYTLSHPRNDRDVTERAQWYTLQDASLMHQSRCSFLNAW